jgi:hypothetical protein
MNKKEKKEMYNRIMEATSQMVVKMLNEEFVAPQKTAAEKLFGMDKKYAARVAAAEAEYYKEHAKPFIERVKSAVTMAQLLSISKEMAKDGFKFPVAGMLDGTDWQSATLENIRWMSYDREGEETAESLSRLEKNGQESGSVANDYMIYTYYYSWRFWIANIIRCLVFWKDPYGAEANEKVKEYIQKIAPHTPIIRKFPTYFKEGAK